MEIAKLVLEYLKVLTWPAIVLTCLIMFRKQLFNIFTRLQKANLPGGVSLDFGKEAEEAKKLSQKVEALPPPEKAKKSTTIPMNEVNQRLISLGLQPSTSGLDMSYYREIAERDPNLALAGLRIELEVVTRNLAKGFGLPLSNRESPMQILTLLRNQGKLTIEQYDLAMQIWKLSSQAVHGANVTTQDAKLVLDAAAVLVEQFVYWLSWGFKDNWKPANNQKILPEKQPVGGRNG
jgi:hypothetical protein